MENPAEQNDLLNFFNKQDKLKTVTTVKKAPPPPKKEVVNHNDPANLDVFKVDSKPAGKAVQDLRALREAKEKSEDQDPENSPKLEDKKQFTWATTQQPTQPKPTKPKDVIKEMKKAAAFPTLKQAMSGDIPQVISTSPTYQLPTATSAPPPAISNAFAGLEDELQVSSSDEEEKARPKKSKNVNTEKSKKPAEPKKPKPPHAAKAEAEKKKPKSKDEEEVEKMMAEMGLAGGDASAKKKGGKKK